MNIYAADILPIYGTFFINPIDIKYCITPYYIQFKWCSNKYTFVLIIVLVIILSIGAVRKEYFSFGILAIINYINGNRISLGKL